MIDMMCCEGRIFTDIALGAKIFLICGGVALVLWGSAQVANAFTPRPKEEK